jgi:putative sigma-54 modulation protein
MRIDINTSGFELTDGLRDHAQKRLEFALDWAKHDVNRVSINLSNINGPRGGRDKRCQIRIPLPGNRDVVLQDTESDLYAAIDLAADRASQTLERRLGRQRDKSINHGRFLSRILNQSDSVAV